MADSGRSQSRVVGGGNNTNNETNFELLFLWYGEQNRFFLHDILVITYLEVLKPLGTLVVQTQKLQVQVREVTVHLQTFIPCLPGTTILVVAVDHLTLLHRLDKAKEGRWSFYCKRNMDSRFLLTSRL